MRLQARIDRVAVVLDRPVDEPTGDPVQLPRGLWRLAQALLTEDEPQDMHERIRQWHIARVIEDAALVRRAEKPQPTWDWPPPVIAKEIRSDPDGWRLLYGDLIDTWISDAADSAPSHDSELEDAVEPAGEDPPRPAVPVDVDDDERARLLREWEESLQQSEDQRRRMRAVIGRPPQELLDLLEV